VFTLEIFCNCVFFQHIVFLRKIIPIYGGRVLKAESACLVEVK
jgi:hypothetical protein